MSWNRPGLTEYCCTVCGIADAWRCRCCETCNTHENDREEGRCECDPEPEDDTDDDDG